MRWTRYRMPPVFSSSIGRGLETKELELIIADDGAGFRAVKCAMFEQNQPEKPWGNNRRPARNLRQKPRQTRCHKQSQRVHKTMVGN